MFQGQLVECFMQRQQLFVGRWRLHFDIIDVRSIKPPTMTLCSLAARSLNKNSAHGFGRRAEKMVSPVERWTSIPDQSQPCFVNKRGRLQCLARAFVHHFRCSESS